MRPSAAARRVHRNGRQHVRQFGCIESGETLGTTTPNPIVRQHNARIRLHEVYTGGVKTGGGSFHKNAFVPHEQLEQKKASRSTI